MEQVYLNYASTSPRKSPRVTGVLTAYLQENHHQSTGRSFEGLEDTSIALKSRLALCKLLDVPNPTQVLFTSGVTASLNMVLHGLLQPGDHVLASHLEHNAVARPLTLLQQAGVIEVDWLPCAPDGTMDPESVRPFIRPNTRLLVMTHASNVLGTILPVEDCFAIAKEYGLFTVLDAAQTAGAIPVTLGNNTDVVAFTGHKALRGLAGSGGFALTAGAAKAIRPWVSGGTGSSSHQLVQPGFLPDKFEPGTPNTLGILSLGTSVEELLETGIDTIQKREQAITQRFLDGARTLPLTIHGTRNAKTSMPVVSVSRQGMDAGVAARELYDRFGVITRSGLHCAPLAHQAMGTFPGGTIRFSFGWDTTKGEIDTALEALARILK